MNCCSAVEGDGILGAKSAEEESGEGKDCCGVIESSNQLVQFLFGAGVGVDDAL